MQPPGTPAGGLAYLAAFNSTGDADYLGCVQEVAEALIYGQLKSGGWQLMRSAATGPYQRWYRMPDQYNRTADAISFRGL